MSLDTQHITVNSLMDLNPASNLLTEFMDFLWANDYSGGILLFGQSPSYEHAGKLHDAPQFGTPDNDDIVDCLEALGMDLKPEQGQYKRVTFDYLHWYQTPEIMQTMVYEINVATSNGNYGLRLKIKD